MNPSIFQTLLKTLPDGILIIGTQDDILFYNDRFIEMWNVPKEIMETEDDLQLIDHVVEQLVEPEKFLEEIERLQLSEFDAQDTLRFLDGKTFIRRSKAWMNAENTPIGRVWVFTDITKIIELDKISCTDFLTGLSNRRLFDRQIKDRFLEFKAKGQNTIIVFVDLDGFKTLNDTYGHEMGDRVLVLLAKTFASLQSVGSVFRYGGDEFYILFPSIDKDKVRRVMEEVLEKFFENQSKYLGLDHLVNFSGGCVTFLEEDISSHEALLRVDALLYKAKRHGKGRIYYTE